MRTLLVFMLAALLSIAQSADTKKIRVEGRVLSTTGEPVRKALVRLVPANFRNIALPQGQGLVFPNGTPETTDDAGRFVFENLTPGSFTISAERTGFLTQRYGTQAPNNPGTVLDLKEGDKLSGLTIQMTPHAVIAGRVVDQDGDPVASVFVRAQRYIYQGGQRQLAIEGTGGTTDDQGNYRISGLPPGRYYVMAERPSFPPTTLATYFPSALDMQSAAPLDVRPGTEQTGTMIRMRREKVFTIRGVVIDGSTGQPSGGASVYAVQPETQVSVSASRNESSMVLIARPSMFNNQVSAGKDGRFVLSNIPSGAYTLIASRGGGVSRSERDGVTSTTFGSGPSAHAAVTVSNQDVEIVLTTMESASVTGRVTVEGGSLEDVSPDTSSLAFLLQAVQGMSINVPNTRVESGGTFRFQSPPPGRYYAWVRGLPPGFYVKSMRSGGQDFTRSPLDLTGGGGEIEIVVAKGTGEIHGSVTDGQGRAAGSVIVSLWPRVPNQSSPNGGVKTATTNASGSFEFTHVLPGDYAVVAFEELPDAGLAQYPPFLDGLTSEAVSYKLEPNGNVSNNVKLISREKVGAEVSKLP